jgi:tRNA_anti-like
MAGKAKKIISAILVLAIAGAVTGYYIWNKPHQDVAGATGKKVAAVELYRSFIADSASAKKNYLQQILEVSGIVASISKNQQQQTVVLIKTATEGASVNCTLEGPADGIKEGNTISVKGICDGIGQGDADLGIMGDVYLVRCFLVK